MSVNYPIMVIYSIHLWETVNSYSLERMKSTGYR